MGGGKEKRGTRDIRTQTGPTVSKSWLLTVDARRWEGWDGTYCEIKTQLTGWRRADSRSRTESKWLTSALISLTRSYVPSPESPWFKFPWFTMSAYLFPYHIFVISVFPILVLIVMLFVDTIGSNKCLFLKCHFRSWTSDVNNCEILCIWQKCRKERGRDTWDVCRHR